MVAGHVSKRHSASCRDEREARRVDRRCSTRSGGPDELTTVSVVSRYRIRTAPQDGRPEVTTVEASSVDEALALARRDGNEVLSVELADSQPLDSEPAGAPPPTAPRPVPHRDTGMGGPPVLMLVGAMFTGIACLFMVIGLAVFATTREFGALLFALFPVIHLIIGVAMLTYSLRSRARRKRLFANGMAATATIDRVGLNQRMRINGRHPYEIGWTFYLHDVAYHGKRTSMNDRLGDFVEGDRIWVLHDPADPTQSVEWPPL